MVNILEILKKIPNLEDMVFYSPLYGDVKVKLNPTYECPIELYYAYEEEYTAENLVDLTANGYYDNIAFGDREIMLYPSRQQRDWSTFKILRKDLPEGTSVMVSENERIWELRKYNRNNYCYFPDCIGERTWNYIIPVDKFNFKDFSFKEEDNYGTTHKS